MERFYHLKSAVYFQQLTGHADSLMKLYVPDGYLEWTNFPKMTGIEYNTDIKLKD
jgi:hypothetical protein